MTKEELSQRMAQEGNKALENNALLELYVNRGHWERLIPYLLPIFSEFIDSAPKPKNEYRIKGNFRLQAVAFEEAVILDRAALKAELERKV